ncbi:hypothetical protein QN277_028271 [Acacia crassicarpa]|uniref:AT-hook motif nuclear-localized protein n=1 Tax=Acacia crassicarpa TaxID=499986 RepID=A0AAE1J594_9FABA|nr:hypothetical protein QN277_028271 [Acacia crassicarpa]
MDGREAMAFSGGPPSYYMHRGGIVGSVPVTHSGGFPPGFRPNTGIPAESNVRGSSMGSTVTVEPVRADYSHIHGMSISSPPGVPPSSERVKKKRGRPRKYRPDGPISLGLSPVPATANSTPAGPASSTPSQRRVRGRPPGSGRKQKLASLGEWMNSSAGMAFAPHVITIGAGEDIAAKLLSISQQRPRVLCILSGTGTVSSITLRQPASSVVSITFEGRFQILRLSGSYLVAEDGGHRSRTGGLSVSLASPDGHVIGGAVAVLIAASQVQVVVCSFIYEGSKTKTKPLSALEGDVSEAEHGNKLATPASAPPSQNYSQPTRGIWQSDLKNPSSFSGLIDCLV